MKFIKRKNPRNGEVIRINKICFEKAKERLRDEDQIIELFASFNNYATELSSLPDKNRAVDALKFATELFVGILSENNFVERLNKHSNEWGTIMWTELLQEFAKELFNSTLKLLELSSL